LIHSVLHHLGIGLRDPGAAEPFFDALLVDHAACERKAFSTGMSLVSSYPTLTPLVTAMIDFSREELDHFRIMHRILVERGLALAPHAPDPYARALVGRIRRGEEATLCDRLLVAGDFNLMPDSAIYRESWSHLQNAFSAGGLGWGYTKREAWVLAARIDHILVGPRWQVVRAWVESSSGSDHRPLVADLVLTR